MDVDGTLEPNRVMTRHGELTGTEPGINFRWYTDLGDPTSNRADSDSAVLWCEKPSCAWVPCHSAAPNYYRDPLDLDPMSLTIDEVWTTDTSDNPKTLFQPEEQVRIHVSLTVEGSESFYVKSINISKSCQKGIWEVTLNKQEATLTGGPYEDYWTWTKTILPHLPFPVSPPCLSLVLKLSHVWSHLGDSVRDSIPGIPWNGLKSLS